MSPTPSQHSLPFRKPRYSEPTRLYHPKDAGTKICPPTNTPSSRPKPTKEIMQGVENKGHHRNAETYTIIEGVHGDITLGARVAHPEERYPLRRITSEGRHRVARKAGRGWEIVPGEGELGRLLLGCRRSGGKVGRCTIFSYATLAR